MNVFFETSGVETALWLPPAVAFAISFLTSMGGVSGAFLLLPFQMSFLGYTSPSVSATNHVFNVVAIPGGVYRYFREGRMVWPLAWIVVIGTLPGVFAGAWIRVFHLPDPGNFKLFAAMVLFYIGLKLVYDLVRPGKNTSSAAESEKRFQEVVKSFRKGIRKDDSDRRISAVRTTQINAFRLGYTFYGEQFEVSVWGVFTLSLIVGIVGGIYGIGGGAIIAPFFVTFFGLPVYTVAGAALVGTFVTSAAGVAFYHAISFFYPDYSIAPDWMLGVLFGAGGMAGMYTGARCQKYVPAKAIKWLLASVIIITVFKYVSEFFMR